MSETASSDLQARTSSALEPQATARNTAFDDFVMQASSRRALGRQMQPRLTHLAVDEAEDRRGVSPTAIQNTPCMRCRSQKLRCDGGRPCRNCVRNAVECKCAPGDTRCSLEHPERPVAFRSNTFSWVLPMGEDESTIGPSMPPAMKIMLGLIGRKAAGFSRRWINNIFQNITPKLYQSVFETLCPIMSAMGKSPNAMRKVPRVSKSPRSFDSFPTCGYTCNTIHYDTGEVHVSINSGFAKIFDRHPEEVLDRMARNNLPPALSEFDMLCSVFDDLPMVMGGKPNGTQYMQRFLIASRALEHTGQHAPVIIRLTDKATYNAHGMMETLEKWMQPVPPEEYDLAMDLTPQLCRPFQRAVGDVRRGHELLRDHEWEFRAQTIGAMAYQNQGRVKLDRLADAIKERYKPLVEEVIMKRLAASEAAASSSTPLSSPCESAGPSPPPPSKTD